MSMARVLLLFGNPGNGKSPLAVRLKADHGFEVISVDDVYVEWVKSQHRNLYFPELHAHILQHYHSILGSHPGFVNQWHAYLLALTLERSHEHDRLVVEGYLLFDCKDAYEQELTRRSVQVFQIEAEKYLYSSSPKLSVEQIASLGEPRKRRR
jgi:hypothetical protein